MKGVVIVGYARSPFTPARRGELARVRPDEMVAQVIRELVSRTGVEAEHVEDLLLGCAFPEGEQGMNMARMVGFIAGLSHGVAGATINRWCGSSMQAVHIAAGAVQMDAGEVFLCAGVESMSRVPMPGYNPLPHPGLAERYPQALVSMGETAENVARRFGVARERQESFALESQRKTAAAIESGRLAAETVPVRDGERVVGQDGCPRADTTAEALAVLKPAFEAGGSVTAGTSSPLTDGAAAVLVCSEEYAVRHDMAPLARVAGIGVAGCLPEIMGMGPVEATRKASRRAGVRVADIELIELNEAFASQALACIDELELDPARVNLDGGAIALGHPLGATGARITGKAASLLGREGGRWALATQCIGGGQGIATVLEGC